MLYLPICPAILLGQTVEEIAAAGGKANNPTTLFSIDTKLTIVPENPTFDGMFNDSNSR
jgi:hypothetical protein